MSYWTVTKGGKTVYRGEAKPKERDTDCVLPSGEQVSKPYHLREGDGDTPTISGKGATARSADKPERVDPARGFSEDNTE